MRGRVNPMLLLGQLQSAPINWALLTSCAYALGHLLPASSTLLRLPSPLIYSIHQRAAKPQKEKSLHRHARGVFPLASVDGLLLPPPLPLVLLRLLFLPLPCHNHIHPFLTAAAPLLRPTRPPPAPLPPPPPARARPVRGHGPQAPGVRHGPPAAAPPRHRRPLRRHCRGRGAAFVVRGERAAARAAQPAPAPRVPARRGGGGRRSGSPAGRAHDGVGGRHHPRHHREQRRRGVRGAAHPERPRDHPPLQPRPRIPPRASPPLTSDGRRPVASSPATPTSRRSHPPATCRASAPSSSSPVSRASGRQASSSSSVSTTTTSTRGAERATAVAQAPDGGGDRRSSRTRCRRRRQGKKGTKGRAAAEAARRGGSPPPHPPAAVRRVRQLGQPGRRAPDAALHRGAGHAVRHLDAARGRLLRGGHVGAPRQLLPRPLRPPPSRVARRGEAQRARRRGVPGVQRHQPVRQVLALHGQPGHPGGLRAGGPRPHHRPRHHAGPPVAGPLPHPRLPPRRAAQGQAHRARRVHGGSRGHREEALRLRRHARPALRVLRRSREGRQCRPGEAGGHAPRGRRSPLAPPLALRCHRLRLQHALAHPKVGPEGGDNGGAGPESLGLLPGALRGGHPLLLGALRLAGRELRRGQPRAPRRRAAAAVQGDPQRAGSRRPGALRRRQVRELAGEARPVGFPRGVARRQRRGAGLAAARHVPLRRVHAR